MPMRIVSNIRRFIFFCHFFLFKPLHFSPVFTIIVPCLNPEPDFAEATSGKPETLKH